MSLRVTGEEVMRWAMCLYNRRSLWQQCGPQILTLIRDHSSHSRLPHIWSKRQSKTPLTYHPVSLVRYYSEDRKLNEGLEEKERLSIQPLQSSFPTENPAEPTETPLEQTPKKIPFYDQLRDCGSPSDVLDLFSEYSATRRQVSNCLTRMWDTTKKMSEEQRRCELQLMFQHPGFEELLQNARKGAGRMRSEDLAYTLLATVKLGVPQRSRVVQTLLRACQENLNEFDERCLSILASCLEHMENGPNVIALKEGMRLVVDARLPSIKNVLALQTMMRLVGKNASLDLKRKLERKALSMSDQFSLPNCQYMISTMATMNFQSKPLLDICSKKITENIPGIPFTRMFLVLKSCKELNYRDPGLLQGISDYVASTIDIWSNKQAILFLYVFEDMLYCPTALMEAFAERVIRKPDALTLRDVLSVLKTYSSLNHHPRDHRQFLDSLTGVLESYLPKMSGPELLKAVHCLCLLGHFPSAPLEHLLQSRTLDQLSTGGEKFLLSQERRFQTVDLCLRLDRPPLPHPLAVPPSVLGDPAPHNLSANPGLSQALRGLLGGRAGATLQEAVVVENLYLIDAVITKPSLVTEGSSPATVQSSPAESSQRIAVICVPHSTFCYGTSHPRGNLAIKIRHLKILGYTPVVTREQELESMSEEGRAEFLRQLIFPEHQGSDVELKAE
ncbi:FAST kinase domain-containing protein 2, mitochondrial isoform 2-T2 [Polymixia lowei]